MKMVKTRSSQDFFNKTLRSDNGIALMLVLGVIAILTFLLADFTFETKLNKIKVYNQQDKIQARLNAESGINFSLAKLRMYQEGRNKIEKDESIKSAFPSSDLEAIIIQPFVYPIPLFKNAGIIQKTALQEFTKKTLFRGELAVSFTKISGFLNPNGLRLKVTKDNSSASQNNNTGLAPGDGDPNDPNDPNEDNKNGENTTTTGTNKTKGERADKIIEKKIVEALQGLLKAKNDNDEDFHAKYSNLDANYLVKELKFYVNDSKNFQDAERPEIESKFSQKKITPKHGPMSSIDELYLLPSWDDAIVDLIKDRMSVHEVNVISINEITIQDLKIIFPSINDIQIEEFFKYRDGDPDKKIKPNKFKNATDFKNVIVTTLNIVSDTEYDERISELKQAGLTIDTSGKLYKVNSRGSFNNAVYSVVAYIDLPIKPPPVKPPPKADQMNDNGTKPKDKENKEEKPSPVELKLPRVIEIRLE